MTLSYDVIVLADFTRGGDAGFRIAQDIRAFRALGARIGVVHLRGASVTASISPDMQQCVRDGLADVLPASPEVQARLVLVNPPATQGLPMQPLTGISADKVVMVHDRKPNAVQVGTWLQFQFGPLVWAPTNRWVRAALRDLGASVPMLDEDWRPVGQALPARSQVPGGNAGVVYGRMSYAGEAQWPATEKEIKAIYPIGKGRDFRVLGRPPTKLWNSIKAISGVASSGAADITAERFLAALDVFIYYTKVKVPAMPEAAIASMMASGRLVVLPPHLEAHFGPGAIYAEPADALKRIETVLADPEARTEAEEAARHHARFQFPEDEHRARCLAVLGAPAPRAARLAVPARKPPVALMVPSNGVGLGHVSRLLAISRRLEDRIEPVFCSLAQVAPVIEDFGYRAEYIPSQGDTGAETGAWDAWFRYQLEEAMDLYDPSVVVFDGNVPPPGLMHAALSRGRTRLAWVRRGMHRTAAAPFLEMARLMDLVIEPGEIAAERDIGPTVARRDEALQVDPITLLDRAEMLPRDAARRDLGLSPDAPAVLVQLGAGSNRNMTALVGAVMEELAPYPDLQIVLAEWENSAVELRGWPRAWLLKGFPLSRYFAAFDFSIAAAGYNTFHEVMAAGLPTIFLANRHPAMDNQGARAEFAQDNGAAFDLPEDQLSHLPALVHAMMKEEVRGYMRAQGAALARENGAHAAAAAIIELAGRT